MEVDIHIPLPELTSILTSAFKLSRYQGIGNLIRTSGPLSHLTCYTVNEKLNSKNSVGLTNAELKEMTRLSADITNMVTTAVSISGSSRKCEDMILVKTMLTPVLNHRSRMEVSLVDGRIIQKYGNHSTYILLSQDAVLSKKTRMFGQDMQDPQFS